MDFNLKRDTITNVRKNLLTNVTPGIRKPKWATIYYKSTGKYAVKKIQKELTLGRGAYRLTLPQLLLGTIKVKVNIETLYKLCDWVLICVRLLWEERKTLLMWSTLINIRLQKKYFVERYLLNDFDQVLKNLSSFSYIFVGNNCSCKVSQNVWAHGLDGI